MFARVPPQQDTTALFSRLRNALSVLQPVRGAICSAVSTRGRSRPLALEQCGYERGCTQTRKNRSKVDNKDARHKHVKTDLTCTSHVSQHRHNASDGIHSVSYLHGIKSRKRQADEGKNTQIRIFQPSSLLTRHPIHKATNCHFSSDEAKHTNTDLPTIIAADTASHP